MSAFSSCYLWIWSIWSGTDISPSSKAVAPEPWSSSSSAQPLQKSPLCLLTSICLLSPKCHSREFSGTEGGVLKIWMQRQHNVSLPCMRKKAIWLPLHMERSIKIKSNAQHHINLLLLVLMSCNSTEFFGYHLASCTVTILIIP